MAQLTIKLSDKALSLIAQLQKEIFNRRRKKVTPAGVVETLVESGAKSQSDKRFATSWKNLVSDIEKAAKVADAHGGKPANLSDEEWSLVLSHRTRPERSTARRTSSGTTTSKTTAKPAPRPKAAAKPAAAKTAAVKPAAAKAAAAKPAVAKAAVAKSASAKASTKASATTASKAATRTPSKAASKAPASPGVKAAAKPAAKPVAKPVAKAAPAKTGADKPWR